MSFGNKGKLIHVKKSVQSQKEPRKRKRNITWFNPPYSKIVKQTLDMPNMKSLINSHNQKILYDQPQISPKSCSCIERRLSMPSWKCVVLPLQSAAKKNKFTKPYKGICEASFKKPFANHKKSFNVEICKKWH